MKKIGLNTMIVLALGGMMTVGQNSVQAGFGLGDITGAKKSADAGAATIDKATFGKSADQAAGNLLAARIAFLDAKAKMMEALGLKTDSIAKAREALEAKTGSATKAGDAVDALKDASEKTKGTDEAMNKAMESSQELSAESKAKFAEGGGKFIEGVLLEKAQIETIQKLVEQGQSLVQSAGPLEKVGVLSAVKPVTAMSTMVPGDVKEGTSTLSKIMKFAQSQKVEIPGSDKATSLLGNGP